VKFPLLLEAEPLNRVVCVTLGLVTYAKISRLNSPRSKFSAFNDFDSLRGVPAAPSYS